ncbi:cobalamin B12-binding domain-containing protein [Salinarimonas sp. NSM]|uniref:cobalamin B12-binding domain-containing protein n=1 Tax=Salinarimonas sp. NSM TaxID=3458003 RepID=UPI00403693A9
MSGHASRRSPRNEADRRDALSRTIEAEIIPRLMLVHSSDDCAEGDRQDPLPSHEEVVEFAGLVIAHDVEVATSYVSVLRARGATLETIFLHLLAPAANHLDTLWREDKADFCDVTIALSRLQQVLRALGAPFEAEGDSGSEEKRVLLASSPGETHTFGVAIVEEFLRRAGWDAVCAPGTSLEELGRIVRADWFDVVGLSLSCESLLAELASAIDIVRRRSRNKHVGVLVGGHYFNEHPESAALVGADFVAFDGLDAVRKAQRFVGGAARAR